MSRAKLQLTSVLLILPVGVGLCVLCLGEGSTESGPEALRPRVVVQATTTAGITEAPPQRSAADSPEAEAPLSSPGEVAHEGSSPEGFKPERHSRAPSMAPSAREGEPAPRLSLARRRALVARVRDRGLSERDRSAAMIALAASPDRDYVPELFREAFPEAPLEEIAPGPIADFESRQALTAALRDPEATVAERALLVAALGPSQGYPEVVSALEGAFADPSPEVRGQVVIELAASQEPQAGDLLRRAAEDPSPEVRLRAVLALGADPAQQPALAAAYDLEGQNRDVKAAIVLQASEHAGTPGGASFLTRVLRDEVDPGLRAEALAALAVAAEADPEGLRAAAGAELPALLESARRESGVRASADAERVLDVLRAG